MGDDVEASDRERIVVSAGQIQNLATTFRRTWQREPSRRELEGLVQDHVEEEVLAREALRVGLDRGDTVIRRRLRQKMEFLQDDVAELAEPTVAELREFFEANADRYQEAPHFTFRHVFLSEARGDALEADARALLDELRAADSTPDVTDLADPTLLPARLENASLPEIASQFGEAFAEELDEFRTLDTWGGPVRSAYGRHLVEVDRRVEGRVPELDEVRETVVRDLTIERREASRQALLEGLLADREVVIEWPEKVE